MTDLSIASTSSVRPTREASEALALKRRRAWHAAALLLLVLLVFGRLCGAEFVEWDDPDTIAQNPDLSLPLGESLNLAWTHMAKGLYVPVTLSVWAILANVGQMSRPDAIGSLVNSWLFHSFNVGCHLCSAVLVLAILRRLSRSEIAAWFGAAVFAIHPLQVEAVAWASGTKDLMCWALGLAVTLLYLRAAQGAADEEPRSLWRSRPGTMTATVLLLPIALLCKPSAMVVPAALFVIDVLLVGRARWQVVLVDLLPLIATAIAGAVVARLAQYVYHIVPAPIWGRPLVMGDALAHYLSKLVWPTRLAIDYGRTPQVVLADRSTYVIWLVPLAVGVAAFLMRRRAPRLFAAALIAVIGLGPVLGLATFQMQGYSTVTDHYTYYSMLGVGLAVTWAIDEFMAAASRRDRPHIGLAIAGLIVATLSVLSFRQASLWMSTKPLMLHALEVNPVSVAMSNNLAAYYGSLDPPRVDLAKPYLDIAVKYGPDRPYTLANRIFCLAALGQLADAQADLDRFSAMLDDPHYDRTEAVRKLTDISEMLLVHNRPEEALRWAQRALDRSPHSPRSEAALRAAQRALADRAATQPTTRPPASTNPSDSH